MFLNSATLASLRFFEAAARHCSFKQAAIELHVTQGAVSQQIKHLEQTLGCKLFYRLPRQIQLTEDGQRFATVVKRAFEDLEREAQSLAAARSGAGIRLRAGPSFALRWLVPRLGDFYARNPDIRLFVTAAYGYFDPAQREFDIAIEMLRDKLPGLQSEVLMKEHLLPVCTPKYLTQHPLEKLSDLADCTLLHDAHPWLGAAEDAEWRYWLDEAGATQVGSRQGQFFTLANLSLEAALTHQGIALGRASLIRELLDAGQLTAPFQQAILSPVQYHILYPRELADRSDVLAVIDWLREQAVSPAAG